MPDPQEAQQLVEALALTGASTVAAAMGTDAWQATRGWTARFFQRRGHSAGEVERQLDNDAALVAGEDADAARSELVGPWRRRLLALLSEDPQAVADLKELIDLVQSRLPADARGSTQNVRVSGHAIANVVQGGNQYNHFMDRPRQEGPEGEASV
ncbi:hypothetical protein OG455_01695 [Kitasatospora sp. NBC_01287]|uniref:hypothetical protein n=1 Tax=Kitasatospora sp. NBC_01287 TaxID=2903573 RepID=UPI002254A10E|nr:hypothetical protein [Kitasatospora sp. NBC_01287]MCX4744238.1 hypothetical protein [Kitasatospora sp. NBC_01287]